MGHLALSFLGGFTVILDAEPVTLFGSDKVRALLAYLALDAARPHRRTELAAMFWSELSEKKASHNLSQSLLRLRQALQEKRDTPTPSFLTVTPQDVQFNQYSDYQLDVARFRDYLHLSQQHQHPAAANCSLCADWLSHAAALYQGDLLAGLFVPDSVAFEEWRLFQQEELHQAALETLRRLTIYHQQRGELKRVQTYARRQIALEPWREEAHVQLMQALAQSGQIAAALNQYEIYQRTLAQQLSLKPAAHVTALYEQIRAGAINPPIEMPHPQETVWLSAPGERRQVTIVACSRVISDEGEDFSEQMAHCHHHCEAVFHRFGGQRAQLHGTTCLIYFGYPQAYEDAAQRAVHSGLAVAAAASAPNPLRIGIHTGPMLVGEKRGPRWQDRDLIGNTVEIARDCQRLAQPGQVIITATTQHLLQTAFALERLTPTLPDTAGQPLSLYRVQAETGVASRLDWLAQTQRLTSFIGREAELHQLQSGWERVQQGVGQVILLSGEAGIGKSRLIWELKERIHSAATSPVRWLTAHCLSHYQNSSLYPMITMLEQLLGIQADDPVAVRRTRLAAQLAQHELNSPSAQWLLSLLLGVPTDTPATETISRGQREQMRKLFVALLQKHAAAQPVVLLIEDLHWADPSTVEWLGQSLDSLAAAPCLTLFTARPSFEPSWLSQQEGQSSPHLLALRPLPAAQAAQIVAALGGEQLPDQRIRHHIITQADGIPLFLEELTKTMLEQMPLKEEANLKTPIPVTLLDSLVARLDHLGAAKETAQWLAVLGRDVSYAVLQACVPYDDTRLQTDLARLIEAELITPLQPAPQTRQRQNAAAPSGHVRYTFKHALVQEAAYGAMLKRSRLTYHHRIATTLEKQFPALAASRPELMAHHLAQAGLPVPAADYWLRAGEHATNQSALLEAKIFFDRALSIIPPDDYERHWQALLGRETALFFQGERAAQEADIGALGTLAEAHNDAARQAQVHIRQARLATTQANYPEQLAAAERAIAAARQAGSGAAELEALAYQLTALMRLRERQNGAAVVARLQTLVETVPDDSIRAYAMAAVAIYHIENGDLAGAAQALSQSLASASHAPTRHLDRESQYYGHLGFTYIQLGLYEEAEAALTSGMELATLLGIGRFQAYHKMHRGYVAWRRGDLPTALALEGQALAEYLASGELFGAAACQGYLGYIYESAGDLAQAEPYLAEAAKGFSEIGVEPDKFEVRSVQARLALRQGQIARAQQLAQEVWHFLYHEGTGGLSSPSWLYLCLIDVLEEIDVPALSLHEVLEHGYQDLMQRAEKLSHPAWRHSFLKNVFENKILIERWEALCGE